MARKTIPAAIKAKPKPTKLSSSSLHPPYLKMISEAISSLKEKTGSSQPAIAKFIEEKYKTDLPPNFKKVLSVQVKKFTKSEKLVKVKNSFKLPVTEKKEKKKPAFVVKEKKEIKKPALVVEEKKQQKNAKISVGGEKEGARKEKKMKRLSQVKTPSALKKTKKKKVSTPKKRVPKTINSPKRAVRKSRVLI